MSEKMTDSGLKYEDLLIGDGWSFRILGREATVCRPRRARPFRYTTRGG